MRQKSKRLKEIEKIIDKSKAYSIKEAIKILKELPHPKSGTTAASAGSWPGPSRPRTAGRAGKSARC